MKLPWRKIGGWLYKLLLKGKTIGGVTLPSQGHTPPTGPSGRPHQPGPDIARRR